MTVILNEASIRGSSLGFIVTRSRPWSSLGINSLWRIRRGRSGVGLATSLLSMKVNEKELQRLGNPIFSVSGVPEELVSLLASAMRLFSRTMGEM